MRTVVRIVSLLTALAAVAVARADEGASRPVTFLERANEAAHRGQWADVESIARAWEKAEPREAMPPLALAQALSSQRRFDGAAEAARRSLERAELPAARFHLGVALGQLGDLAGAERELARGAALAPEDGNLLRAWAGALASRGRYAEAARILERARAALPPNLGIDDQLAHYRTASGWEFPGAALELHGRAGWLLERERWQEAADAYRAALKLAPGFADCRYHLGWALHGLGDDDAAEQEYRAAIAGYGKAEVGLAADARYNLAQALSARRRHREAIPLLREAVAVRGERFWLLHALGGACRADGDARCAREAWQKLLGSHEQLPDGVRESVQRELAELGGTTEVKEEPALRTGSSVDSSASRRCDHGTVLAEQGRTDEARRDFEAALADAPEFGFCRINLAVAFRQSGDAAGAEREVRRALASRVPSTDDELEERAWRARGRLFLAQLVMDRSGPPTEIVSLVREAEAVLGPAPYTALLLAAGCDAAGDCDCALAAVRRALAGRERLSASNVAEAERLLKRLGSP